MPPRRTRSLIALATLLLVATVVVPTAWGISLRLDGVAQALAGSMLLVGCSALALNGSRPVTMSAKRAVPAVLATTAANAITPAGVGGTLLVLRIHRRSGLSAEQAAAAAGLRTVMGAITATAFTALAATTVGMEELPSGRTTLLVGFGIAAALAAVTILLPHKRRSAVESAGRFAAAVWDVVRKPRCFVSLLVGCAGVSIAQLITLQGAVHAVGGHIPLSHLLVALVGSTAARSAVPSPGGVGPVEAALIGGLTALGLGWATAATAVAVYRTAGHWLPVVAGVISLGELRRRELV